MHARERVLEPPAPAILGWYMEAVVCEVMKEGNPPPPPLWTDLLGRLCCNDDGYSYCCCRYSFFLQRLSI